MINRGVIASSHAMDRWREYGCRGDIIEAFEKAVYVGDDLWDEEDVQNYALDDLLFVYNAYEKKIITVIKASYGFSEDINKTIARKQIKVIVKLLDSIKTSEARLLLKEKSLGTKIATYDNHIAALEAQIASVKHLRRAAVEELDGARKGVLALKKRHNTELRKLHYSINYRVEQLPRRNAR